MPGQYSSHCRLRPCALLPAATTGRLFLCARCQAQVLVCSRCDRGQIYCAQGCAQTARRGGMVDADAIRQRAIKQILSLQSVPCNLGAYFRIEAHRGCLNDRDTTLDAERRSSLQGILKPPSPATRSTVAADRASRLAAGARFGRWNALRPNSTCPRPARPEAVDSFSALAGCSGSWRAGARHGAPQTTLSPSRRESQKRAVASAATRYRASGARRTLAGSTRLDQRETRDGPLADGLPGRFALRATQSLNAAS
jgi:hypothetical protein